MKLGKPAQWGSIPRLAGLAAALWLASCAAANADPASAIQGRWQHDEQPGGGFIHDPAGSLTGATFELRPGGVLANLSITQSTGQAWLVDTGEYRITDPDRITISGKCWQGWESHGCSQVYSYKLDGDHLTIGETGQPQNEAKFTRIGPFSETLAPTIVPPGPSPTPAP